MISTMETDTSDDGAPAPAAGMSRQGSRRDACAIMGSLSFGSYSLGSSTHFVPALSLDDR